jgi:release factor glutamine methyltransferase
LQLSTALDFGTGSGCLAIALAAKCPGARLYAIDVSAEALELAKQNAGRHCLAERICFLEGDGLAVLPDQIRFDLIVSNPPYIPTAELDTLQPEVRDFDPRLALDGGPDGLDYYRRLAAEAGPWLNAGGKIMLEFGDGQVECVGRLFRSQKWVVERIAEDYTQRPRILIARKPD